VRVGEFGAGAETDGDRRRVTLKAGVVRAIGPLARPDLRRYLPDPAGDARVEERVAFRLDRPTVIAKAVQPSWQ
jgi:hypothetical protein